MTQSGVSCSATRLARINHAFVSKLQLVGCVNQFIYNEWGGNIAGIVFFMETAACDAQRVSDWSLPKSWWVPHIIWGLFGDMMLVENLLPTICHVGWLQIMMYVYIYI